MAKRSPRTTAGKPRRVPVSTKITPDLRDRLEAEAQSEGRTLGNEIERRLERSLLIPKDFDRLIEDKGTIRVLCLIAQSWNVVEAFMLKSWYEDKDTIAAAKSSAAAIIGSLTPQTVLPDGPSLHTRQMDLERIGQKSSEFITSRLTGSDLPSDYVSEVKALIERTTRDPATHAPAAANPKQKSGGVGE